MYLAVSRMCDSLRRAGGSPCPEHQSQPMAVVSICCRPALLHTPLKQEENRATPKTEQEETCELKEALSQKERKGPSFCATPPSHAPVRLCQNAPLAHSTLGQASWEDLTPLSPVPRGTCGWCRSSREEPPVRCGACRWSAVTEVPPGTCGGLLDLGCMYSEAAPLEPAPLPLFPPPSR